MTYHVIDQLGEWSQIKNEILDQYAHAYTRVLKNQQLIERVLYIDAFAGSGYGENGEAGQRVRASAVRALQVAPSFGELHFIESRPDAAAVLEAATRDDPRATVHCGDVIDVLRGDLLPRCRYEDYSRALCLIGPDDLTVPWSLVLEIGAMCSVDLFYPFKITDTNGKALWGNPNELSVEVRERMDAVWGNDSWQLSFSQRRPDVRGAAVSEKRAAEEAARAFRRRLHRVAKFAYVPDPVTMRDGDTLYSLFFASPTQTGAKVVEPILNKYRR